MTDYERIAILMAEKERLLAMIDQIDIELRKLIIKK
jgi:hypothetical protein